MDAQPPNVLDVYGRESRLGAVVSLDRDTGQLERFWRKLEATEANEGNKGLKFVWNPFRDLRFLPLGSSYRFPSSRRLKSKLNIGSNVSALPCSNSVMPGGVTDPNTARIFFTSGCSRQTENASILTNTSLIGS